MWLRRRSEENIEETTAYQCGRREEACSTELAAGTVPVLVPAQASLSSTGGQLCALLGSVSKFRFSLAASVLSALSDKTWSRHFSALTAVSGARPTLRESAI